MDIQQWHDAGDYFEFAGQQIFFLEEGEGAPLLLIHGFPTASWDWAKIWAPLAERYRCITLDMLGFGYSDKPQQSYSIFQQADIFCALVERLGLDSCHVLAHDYGDTVAQELLARQEQGTLNFRMQTLTLLNGGLFPETHRAVLTQKLLLSPLGSLLSRFMSRKAFTKNFHSIFGPSTPPSADEIDGFWQLINHKQGTRVMHRLIHYMVERRHNRERWVGALQNAGIPIRLIDGLLDPVSGAHMVERYEQLIPNPDIVKLAGVGHYPQVEAPDAVLAAVLEHLQTGHPNVLATGED